MGIIAAALLLLATAGHATRQDLGALWASYASTGASAEPAYTFPHSTCFKAAALQYDLPETLLLAVARGESDFEPTARSRANAHGVMQILWPDTARHLGIFRLSQLYDPCTNIDAGARYLRELLGRYEGNLHLALDGVAGSKVEAANLGGRNVGISTTCSVTGRPAGACPIRCTRTSGSPRS